MRFRSDVGDVKVFTSMRPEVLGRCILETVRARHAPCSLVYAGLTAAETGPSAAMRAGASGAPVDGARWQANATPMPMTPAAASQNTGTVNTRNAERPQ